MSIFYNRMDENYIHMKTMNLMVLFYVDKIIVESIA